MSTNNHKPGMAASEHRIRSIEISHHRLDFTPPFQASWDTKPRFISDATIVRVATNTGLVGYGSGDRMVGFAGHESLFIGEDPLRLSVIIGFFRTSIFTTAVVGRSTLHCGILPERLLASPAGSFWAASQTGYAPMHRVVCCAMPRR